MQFYYNTSAYYSHKFDNQSLVRVEYLPCGEHALFREVTEEVRGCFSSLVPRELILPLSEVIQDTSRGVWVSKEKESPQVRIERPSPRSGKGKSHV